MTTEEMFAGFSVAAGDDRSGERVTLGGEPNDCKVSAQDTAVVVRVRVHRPRRRTAPPSTTTRTSGSTSSTASSILKSVTGGSAWAPASACSFRAKAPHVWAARAGKPGRSLTCTSPRA